MGHRGDEGYQLHRHRRHDVPEPDAARDEVQCHRRRLRRRLAAVPDQLRQPERVRLSRPVSNLHGLHPEHARGQRQPIGNNDPCRWDTSQIQADTQCNTYTGASTLLASRTVTGIQLVVDSGWFFADKEQTVLVCDIRINNSTVFPCAGAGGPGGGGANKITICHHTKHKSTGATKHVTIRISQSASPARQKHGDTMGACTSPESIKAHKNATHVKKFHKQGKAAKGKGKGKGKG